MPAATGDPVSALILEVASKVENARAKVNLALHVTGGRPDGYHLLDSLVVFAEIADTLRRRAARRSRGRSSPSTASSPTISTAPAHRSDNLVMRAADELMAGLSARDRSVASAST